MMGEEVYICGGLRTPIGRFAGTLSSVRPDDMLAHVIKSVVAENPNLPKEAIDEVIVGCANQAGEDNRNVARMATLLAGLPVSVPAITVNRLCASGMDAVAAAGRAIACGEADVIIAGGVESMSRAPLVMPKADTAFSRKAEIYDTTIGWRFVNKKLAALYGTDSMPETGENVAEQFSISREDQDVFALKSQQKAAASTELRAVEIVPVTIPQRKRDDVVFNQDEHPRASTSLEKLSTLGTPFKENGTVTAGNASGVNDGACALLIASASAVEKYGLQPISRIRGFSSAGIEPAIMGYGPVPAVNRLLKRESVDIADIDVIELNEAFASQSLAVLRGLNVADDDARVNAWGGAIALGHPLGMSGARLVLTASRQLQEKNAKLGLCTMCVGVGQGVAMLLERA
ncbi:3-oxoadipyl-CoA thiolase [Marinicella sp. W31]|uniref:3-oxoadipyl-CoA thiolase n=1 Tax=Marinicella sp. W31 TaxID=3023713 RepID=UPI00375692BF